jgi:DNA-binding transcriptional LysR family regulator
MGMNSARDEYALFAAVVEAGSLTGAARALRLSPAMVSKRLVRLEQRLGVQLVRRTTRRLALTDVGEAFHQRVVAILDAVREAEALVAGRATTPAGRLRVSAPTSFGRLHIAPRLHEFLDAHPQLRLEIDLTDTFVDLLAERIDVAVRIAVPAADALAWHRLAANRRVLCAAPGYLAAHGEPRTLEELRRHRLLAAAGQSPWRLEGRAGLRTVDVDSHVRTHSSEIVRELVLGGGGIALRSTWDVAQDLRDGRLLRVLPGYQGAADVGVYAVCPRSERIAPSVRAFIEFLQRLYAPVPAWDRL